MLKNRTMIHPEIIAYNQHATEQDTAIFEKLAKIISENLQEAENKIWHAHPVWFLEGNPIVGYSKQKNGIRFMFWSGADFEEDNLAVRGEKFKDASIFYQSLDDIVEEDIKRWIEKARIIQWDYKNLIKRKGKLERL